MLSWLPGSVVLFDDYAERLEVGGEGDVGDVGGGGQQVRQGQAGTDQVPAHLPQPNQMCSQVFTAINLNVICDFFGPELENDIFYLKL